MIEFRVGSLEQVFIIHEGLVTHYSPHFENQLREERANSSFNGVKLPNIIPRTFTIVVDWLYSKELKPPAVPWDKYQISIDMMRESGGKGVNPNRRSLPSQSERSTSSKGASRDKDRRRSSGVNNSRYSEIEASMSCEDSLQYCRMLQQWHEQDLMRVFLFAETYDMKELRNDVMTLWQGCENVLNMLPSLECIEYAYNRLPPVSMLRHYFLSSYARVLNPSAGGNLSSELRKLPRRFLADLALTALAKLRSVEDEHQCPRKHYLDYCRYHDHEDDEEKRICRSKWKKAMGKTIRQYPLNYEPDRERGYSA